MFTKTHIEEIMLEVWTTAVEQRFRLSQHGTARTNSCKDAEPSRSLEAIHITLSAIERELSIFLSAVEYTSQIIKSAARDY